MKYLYRYILLTLFISWGISTKNNDSAYYKHYECLDFDEYIQQQHSALRVKEYSRPMGAPQYCDDDGTILPWYTKPFLEVLTTWDIKEWDIFEWGSGYSTVWYALHCKSITSVENNQKWAHAMQENIQQLGLANATIKLRKTGYSIGEMIFLSEGGQTSEYVLAINENDAQYDCIIIDGMHRNTCAQHILAHLKPGGIIIVDNANQKSIGIDSTATFRLLDGLKHYSYLQPDCAMYPDWRTDYWIYEPTV